DLIRAQRDAAWGEVARRLAHEIKNPLTPIQLSAERIEHKLAGQLSPDQAKVLTRSTQTIIKQVDAMKDMVNAFRDYASTPPAHPENLDINQLVMEVADLYHGYQDSIQLKTHLADDLPLLLADPARLRQVLHNLIKNAFEALGEQAGEIHVTSRYRGDSQGHYIELEFSDTGSGIDPELLENLFEPYVTSKQGGTGLGLAIVNKIVEEHGGMVIASNSPEGGARFTVRLPEKGSFSQPEPPAGP
ncbi:MAG TPA: GHKL domain-containing protein, partial [Gammaproteobacteria bacterium]|nr:GHKL domain-containing protein [Gammaproteobacteria bacterium]